MLVGDLMPVGYQLGPYVHSTVSPVFVVVAPMSSMMVWVPPRCPGSVTQGCELRFRVRPIRAGVVGPGAPYGCAVIGISVVPGRLRYQPRHGTPAAAPLRPNMRDGRGYWCQSRAILTAQHM